MILGEQKPDGKRKLIKQTKGKYNQLYNGAWNEHHCTIDCTCL